MIPTLPLRQSIHKLNHQRGTGDVPQEVSMQAMSSEWLNSLTDNLINVGVNKWKELNYNCIGW